MLKNVLVTVGVELCKVVITVRWLNQTDVCVIVRLLIYLKVEEWEMDCLRI